MTYEADLIVHQEHNQEAEISILRSTLGELRIEYQVNGATAIQCQ